MAKKIELRIEDCLPRGLTLSMLPHGLPIACKRPRKIVTRGGARVRGELVDSTHSRAQWESDPERALVQLLRVCRQIAHVFTQPLVLDFGGRQYTPDCLAMTKSGRRLWFECKPESELVRQEVRLELAEARCLFTALGEDFIVLNEHSVSTGLAAADNAQLMAVWMDAPGDQPPAFEGSMTFATLAATRGAAEHVLAGMAHGWYAFDWDKRICRETIITWDATQGGYVPAFLQDVGGAAGGRS